MIKKLTKILPASKKQKQFESKSLNLYVVLWSLSLLLTTKSSCQWRHLFSMSTLTVTVLWRRGEGGGHRKQSGSEGGIIKAMILCVYLRNKNKNIWCTVMWEKKTFYCSKMEDGWISSKEEKRMKGSPQWFRAERTFFWEKCSFENTARKSHGWSSPTRMLPVVNEH